MRVIVIHGTGGSPAGNWFPWLCEALAKQQIETLVPALPTPDGQSLAAWGSEFDRVVGDVSADDVLIGHSIGSAFVCRLLERQRVHCKLVVLVSPFARQLGLADFDPLNRSFVEAPFDWDIIRSNSANRVVIHGDDDPYVPLLFAKEVAGALCSELIVIPSGGHLNSESGYGPFPLLLELLEAKALQRIP